MRPFRLVVLLCIAFLPMLPTLAQDEALRVVATTSIITDIAQNVGGDFVHVTSLVPAESDIHAFQPRPSDLRMLADADIVLANGLGLEGFLDDVIAAADMSPVIVTEGIDAAALICVDDDHEAEATEEAHADDHDEHGACDPHVWGNPQNVIAMVTIIAETFAAYDPENAATYAENAAAYITELEALDAGIEALFSEIPAEERLLVTNHEFLAYFADHYGFTVVGTVLPGVSTLAEPTARELADLSQQILELGVPAIFVEASASEGISQMLVAELGDSVQIVGLYSDALSAADGVAATYLDFMRFNATAIATVFQP